MSIVDDLKVVTRLVGEGRLEAAYNFYRYGSVYGTTCKVCHRYKHQCLNPTDLGRPIKRKPHEWQPDEQWHAAQ
jgi:hypothetical protein